MIKKEDLIALAFVAFFVCLFGVFDGVKDTLAHHYSISVFSPGSTFWNADVSWCNKWQNCEAGKERFLGSSTVFVWLTDGWHLMKFLQNRIWLAFPTQAKTHSKTSSPDPPKAAFPPLPKAKYHDYHNSKHNALQPIWHAHLETEHYIYSSLIAVF